MEGKLHLYHPTRHLNIFEFTPLPATEASICPFQTPPNILLFIGGLFDNFGTPPYVSDLAQLFPRHQTQQWTVMHVQLSSAMKGWGVSNLDRDIDETATCIKYIRNIIRPNQPTNIVLMGHSTGCQDTVHYLYSPNPTTPHHQTRPPVQGAILQAPVSDREALLSEINTTSSTKTLYDKCIDLASSTPKEEWPTTILNTKWTYPLYHTAPLSISRFMSLSSPSSPQHPMQDDLFSSDLPDSILNSTFGRIYTNNLLSPPQSESPNPTTTTPSPPSLPSILILISNSDPSMPPSISKPLLLTRWSKALSSSQSSPQPPLHQSSTCIPNANHDISGSSPSSLRARLIHMSSAVVNYLSDTVGDIDSTTRNILKKNEKTVLRLEKESSGESVDEKVEKMKL